MRLLRLVFLPVLTLALAACSGGGATSTPSAPPASPEASAPSASSAAQTIEVKLSDSLKMEPAEITVKAGQPVRFVVTNTGAIDHEFYVGDEAAQAAHEQEMMSMGGMMPQDEEDGIVIKPGETKELTHTFAAPGGSFAGCHVTGHYAAGMKATITVTE